MTRYGPPPLRTWKALLDLALEEDIAWGDITSDTAIPLDDWSKARLVARQPGVLCGGPIVRDVFRRVDPAISVDLKMADGLRLAPGDVVAEIDGPTRPVLAAERVALNLVQRLSGIATLTAAFVAKVDGLSVRIVDTRKTTPGLRVLEKYAVRCGGGHNHRFGLADAVLLKDNHLQALANRGLDLTAAIRRVRETLPHTMRVEVEVDRLDQVEPVLAGGADVILLDNMTPDQLRQAVTLVRGRAVTEASGGITLDTVRAIAESGVDVISSGALTHSAPALDFGLDVTSTIDDRVR